jgi:hypothetical protein
MTMSGNRQPLPPTWTLARLYEDQNQLMDALAAYELIRKSTPDPQVDEAIERLLHKILIESNAQYDPIIDQIFSPDDKIKFRIAPEEICEAYDKAKSQVTLRPVDDDILSEDEEDDIQIILPRETYTETPQPQIQKPAPVSTPIQTTASTSTSDIDQEELMRHIITAKENLGEEMSTAEKKAVYDMSVIQLIDLFQSFLGNERKITELKIRDLIEFWQDIQLEYGNES